MTEKNCLKISDMRMTKFPKIERGKTIESSKLRAYLPYMSPELYKRCLGEKLAENDSVSVKIDMW